MSLANTGGGKYEYNYLRFFFRMIVNGNAQAEREKKGEEKNVLICFL